MRASRRPSAPPRICGSAGTRDLVSTEQRDGGIFEIVNQLNCGTDLIDSGEERREVAALNLAAGKRAKAATAYLSALRYLSIGRTLLSADAWDRSHRLTFDLELNLAECEFLNGNFESAAQRLSLLSARAADLIDLAAATRLSIDLYVTMGEMDRAVHVGLEFLRRVDPELPLHITTEDARREHERLSERLNRAPIGGLLDLRPMTDPLQRATMDVLTALSSPTLFAGDATPPAGHLPDGGQLPRARKQRRRAARLCLARQHSRHVLRGLPGRAGARKGRPRPGRATRVRQVPGACLFGVSPSTSSNWTQL